MSDDIQKMIDDINDKNFSDANKTFTDLLNQKLSDALDQEKVSVADSIYGEEEVESEVEETEEIDDESLEHDEPEYEEEIDDALSEE